jgi:hypothetical protein
LDIVSRSYSRDTAETYSSPPSPHLYSHQATINSTAAYPGRHGAYDSPQKKNLLNYSVSPRINEAPPSNVDKAHQHIPSIDELVQDTAKAEALFQSYFNRTTMLSGEAHNLRPIIVERFQRLLKILRNEHSSSSESNKKAIHKALHSFVKSLEKVSPVPFSDQCDESDCSGDDAMRDAPRPPSSYFSPTLEWITSNAHEPEKSQQISVEVGGLDEGIRLDIDTSHKGGRPPKQWPHSGRRLLARFVTAAFPNLTFVQQALKQDGFAVRLVARTICSYQC